MKQNIKNNRLRLLGILLLFVGMHCTTLAQDSLFQNQFKRNITQLNELFCWDNSTFYSGNFLFNSNVNFQDELQKNILFAEVLPNAASYFKQLNGISISDKQKLIQYFSYYEALFEQELDAAKLPKELKCLAPVLSAMNPLAVDKNKRAGIWQLTHFQGVLNGLQINRLVDERLNEAKATTAFVLQIQQNKTIFGNNELAVLAYLAGNTKLKNTLARCSEKPTISEVLERLPNSVKETISAYQAMFVFLRVNSFEPSGKSETLDNVTLNRQVHFKQISQVLNIPEKQLQFLNPQYIYSIIPGDEKTASVTLPNGKHDEFLLASDSIYHAYDSSLFQVVAQKIEYAPASNRQYVGEKVKDLEIEGKTKIKYTIKSGDVLGFIAEDYDVRVADLKYWNNIYNERKIQAGKTLNIFVDDANADYYKSLQPAKKRIASNSSVKKTPIAIPANARKVQHTVKSGESPYIIAKKYDGVSPEAILEWNGIEDARKIQIGQKLIIYLVN